MQWSSKIIAGLQSLERSLKLTGMGLSSVTIKKGYLTRFLHLEGIRKAGYGYSNYQKVASHITLDDTSKFLPGMKSYLKNAYKIRTNIHL